MSETDDKRNELHNKYHQINLAIDELVFRIAEGTRNIDILTTKRKELFNEIMAFDRQVSEGESNARTPIGPQQSVDKQADHSEPVTREAAPASGAH